MKLNMIALFALIINLAGYIPFATCETEFYEETVGERYSSLSAAAAVDRLALKIFAVRMDRLDQIIPQHLGEEITELAAKLTDGENIETPWRGSILTTLRLGDVVLFHIDITLKWDKADEKQVRDPGVPRSANRFLSDIDPVIGMIVAVNGHVNPNYQVRLLRLSAQLPVLMSEYGHDGVLYRSDIFAWAQQPTTRSSAID